jgi:hypothetical protein
MTLDEREDRVHGFLLRKTKLDTVDASNISTKKVIFGSARGHINGSQFYIDEWIALLLAEGGMPTIYPPEWIGKLRPQVVLFSTGADDPRCQPDPELLQAMEGYTLLRTDRNGWNRSRRMGSGCGLMASTPRFLADEIGAVALT